MIVPERLRRQQNAAATASGPWFSPKKKAPLQQGWQRGHRRTVNAPIRG